MDYFGNTDIGQKRKTNQDSFCSVKLGEKALLLAVFDGMGGHAGGETASGMARENFSSVAGELLLSKVCEESGMVDATKTQIFNIMCKGAEQANTAIFEAAQNNSELTGMGTTLAAVLINGDNIYAVNVGDSRIYLVYKDRIQQLSHDHSYVQYLVDIGEITEEEAKVNANKNIITRAVGTSPELDVDTFAHPLDGAGVLLCSDGLTNFVENEDIQRIFRESATAEECVGALISAANCGGGLDNITAVVAGSFGSELNA